VILYDAEMEWRAVLMHQSTPLRKTPASAHPPLSLTLSHRPLMVGFDVRKDILIVGNSSLLH
jgi:hypothetical protein